MPGRPPLANDELYEVATYLARPEVHTVIHAEMPERGEAGFRQKYDELTGGEPLPVPTHQGPFYVWPAGTNKYGRELRIYFRNVAPVPPVMERLYADYGKWYAMRQSYRVNHTALVFQLLECGFLIGDNSGNTERIQDFMERRFPPLA